MPKYNSHDRIIFNGYDLSNIVMCQMERAIMPPVEITRETIGGRHGETFRRARMQGYTIPVTVWLRTKDRRNVAELRHRLAALLMTDEPAPLYLPDDATRYYLAIVDGDTSLGAITDGIPKATINFYVCDPIAYGNPRKETLTNGTAKTVDAGGTYKAAPLVRSTTAGGTWRIENQTTDEFVELTADTVGYTIPSGQAVVCDMEQERITLNGLDTGVTLDSDFFTIEGETVLRVSGGTGTTLDWRERWL